MEGNNKSNQVLLIVIGIATLLMAVVGATFAYFTATATATNPEDQETVSLKTATLGITYTHGTGVNLTNTTLTADYDSYIPFSVENTGTVATGWKLLWDMTATGDDAINEILGYANLETQAVGTCSSSNTVLPCYDVREDFTYTLYKVTAADDTAFNAIDTETEWGTATLTAVTSGTAGTGYLADVVDGTTTPIRSGLSIAAAAKEYYVLKVSFNYLEDTTNASGRVVSAAQVTPVVYNNNQNYQQNKAFKGAIKVEVDGTYAA